MFFLQMVWFLFFQYLTNSYFSYYCNPLHTVNIHRFRLVTLAGKDSLMSEDEEPESSARSRRKVNRVWIKAQESVY